MFQIEHRFHRGDPGGSKQSNHEKEKEERGHHIDDRLGSGTQAIVQDRYIDMSTMAQDIGTSQGRGGQKKVLGALHRPDGRAFQEIAGHHLVGHDQHHAWNQEGGNPTGPFTDGVYCFKNTPHVRG